MYLDLPKFSQSDNLSDRDKCPRLAPSSCIDATSSTWIGLSYSLEGILISYWSQLTQVKKPMLKLVPGLTSCKEAN